MTIYYKSIYSDKTSFTFSEDDSGKGDYAKIDREKLICQEIYRDSQLLHRLHLEKGQRLILRSRGVKTMSGFALMESQDKQIPLLDIAGTFIKLYLIGYQETVNGENRQNITVIFSDDWHTENISQWKNAPLNAISLTEEEK